MPVPRRSIVYRVRGLPPQCTPEQLGGILQSQLLEDEIPLFHPKISIIPSCYSDDNSFTALLTVDTPPRFLSELNEDPLTDWPIETEDGDISFDRHFHGFTQMYTTPKDKPIIAE